MNERIDELSKKAVDYANACKAEAWDGAYERKFAELIVSECIGCCEQVISDPVPKSVDTWLNGGSQCIDQIKKHFGVDGMSTEDKKTLIKELLGVKND